MSVPPPPAQALSLLATMASDNDTPQDGKGKGTNGFELATPGVAEGDWGGGAVGPVGGIHLSEARAPPPPAPRATIVTSATAMGAEGMVTATPLLPPAPVPPPPCLPAEVRQPLGVIFIWSSLAISTWLYTLFSRRVRQSFTLFHAHSWHHLPLQRHGQSNFHLWRLSCIRRRHSWPLETFHGVSLLLVRDYYCQFFVKLVMRMGQIKPGYYARETRSSAQTVLGGG